jgi:hypothetical protein
MSMPTVATAGFFYLLPLVSCEHYFPLKLSLDCKLCIFSIPQAKGKQTLHVFARQQLKKIDVLLKTFAKTWLNDFYEGLINSFCMTACTIASNFVGSSAKYLRSRRMPLKNSEKIR